MLCVTPWCWCLPPCGSGAVGGVPRWGGWPGARCGTPSPTAGCDSREGSLQAAPLGPDHLPQRHERLPQEVLRPEQRVLNLGAPARSPPRPSMSPTCHCPAPRPPTLCRRSHPSPGRILHSQDHPMHTLDVPWTHHVPHQSCSTSSGPILHPTATTHPLRDRFPSVADTYLLPVPMRHGETKSRVSPPRPGVPVPPRSPLRGTALGCLRPQQLPPRQGISPCPLAPRRSPACRWSSSWSPRCSCRWQSRAVSWRPDTSPRPHLALGDPRRPHAPFPTPRPLRAVTIFIASVLCHGVPRGLSTPALFSLWLRRHSHVEAEVLLLLEVVIEDKLADEVGVEGVVDHLGAPKLRREG